MASSNSNFKARAIRVTKQHEDECFERLPRPVRDALNGAKFDWSAAGVFRIFKKGKSTQALVSMIARWDTVQEEKDAGRVWGRQHAVVTAEDLGI